MLKTKLFILLITFFLLSSAPALAKTQVDRLTAPTPELIQITGSKAVYYHAVDGKRYVFPDQKTYQTWFSDFSAVKTISAEAMGAISIGGNVCYKPNSRLVKITTDPKVYWVGESCQLRHLASESLAISLFGANWASLVNDLPDPFFVNYAIGEALTQANLPTIPANWTIDDDQNLFLPVNNDQIITNDTNNTNTTAPVVVFEADQQPKSINLTVTTKDQDVTLEWFADGGNLNYGVAIVKSTSSLPVYPTNDYIIPADKNASQYVWQDLSNGGAYYFRLCRLNSDNTCGVYSDQESIAVGASDKTKAITLVGEVVNGVAKLAWQTEWSSPDNGFYLVRGADANPRYPTNPNVWLDKIKENYNWEGLNGTQHFRVCQYAGSRAAVNCEIYSNDLELTIQ
jgi:hypothetical protein